MAVTLRAPAPALHPGRYRQQRTDHLSLPISHVRVVYGPAARMIGRVPEPVRETAARHIRRVEPGTLRTAAGALSSCAATAKSPAPPATFGHTALKIDRTTASNKCSPPLDDRARCSRRLGGSGHRHGRPCPLVRALPSPDPWPHAHWQPGTATAKPTECSGPSPDNTPQHGPASGEPTDALADDTAVEPEA